MRLADNLRCGWEALAGTRDASPSHICAAVDSGGVFHVDQLHSRCARAASLQVRTVTTESALAGDWCADCGPVFSRRIRSYLPHASRVARIGRHLRMLDADDALPVPAASVLLTTETLDIYVEHEAVFAGLPTLQERARCSFERLWGAAAERYRADAVRAGAHQQTLAEFRLARQHACDGDVVAALADSGRVDAFFARRQQLCDGPTVTVMADGLTALPALYVWPHLTVDRFAVVGVVPLAALHADAAVMSWLTVGERTLTAGQLAAFANLVGDYAHVDREMFIELEATVAALPL
jgi:hypothetical protein